MSKLERILCPECGGAITIWFDMNTQIEYPKRFPSSRARVTTTTEKGVCSLWQ